jgi:penicillin-binding protein 2
MTTRLAALGVIFSVMLGILLTKLWFVQVAQGAEFEAAAQGQQIKPVPTVAPRGTIVDRDGRLVAGIDRRPTLVIDPTRIGDEAAVEALIQEIAGLADGVASVDVRAMFDAAAPDQVFPLKGLEIDEGDAMFVLGNHARFPGTSVEWTPVRTYPLGSLGAHVVGYAAAPSAEDLDERPELDRNGTVGKAGVERSYDEALQGEQGQQFYDILPSGQIIRLAWEEPAIPGDTVTLSLDMETQGIAEQALRDGIRLSRETQTQEVTDEPSQASTGSVVVLDARTGHVVAMASVPAYRPQEFVEGIDAGAFQELLDQRAFNNLAIQGLFAPGSTFKAITYLTAYREGVFAIDATTQTPEGTIRINGEGRLDVESLEENSQKVFYDHCRDVTVDLHVGFQESCNIYFWQTALNFWERSKEGGLDEAVLQDTARELGLGSDTGVDLPFEAGGRIPDRALFEALKEAELARDEGDPVILHESRLLPGGLWVGGDLMNVAIGQGDVLATPLQMAVAYTALSTGTVFEPRVVSSITDFRGTVVDEPVAAATALDLPPGFLADFRSDLQRVTNAGTAEDAFSVMDQPWRTGGKTGTADVDPRTKLPHSWFVGVVPVDAPEYVVAVVVEEGGAGSAVAAPVARAIMQHLLGEEVDPVIDDGELGSPLPWDDDYLARPGDEPSDEPAVLPERVRELIAGLEALGAAPGAP